MADKKPPLKEVKINRDNQQGSALEEAMDFIYNVFGELPDGEYVCLLKAPIGKPPNFPAKSIEEFERLCKRAGKLMSCYYSTATTIRAPDGRLYNRKENFKGLWVIVLDDIGTGPKSKCRVEDLPESMRLNPTYIIETSKDNFQYGYVLEGIVDDLGEADALVRAIYDAGPWDGGGAQTTKLVRLPLGYHKSGFPVRLVSYEQENLWSPEALIEATGATPGAVKKRRVGRASRFGRGVVAYDFDGVVDPVVDVLQAAGEIYGIGADWLKIKCPWSDTHGEDGDDSAGYSALGMGGENYGMFRSFKCFHDHCSDRKTSDFLQLIADQYNLSVPAYDPSGLLLRDYLYDQHGDTVVHISSGSAASINAFRNNKAGDVSIYIPQRETTKSIPLVTHWLKHKYRLNVVGSRPIPWSDDCLVETAEGLVYNSYQHPDHAYISTPDATKIAWFYDFIEYLIPDAAEREYFLNWFAQGVQDPRFRGAIPLMVAQAQGTGRNSLSKIMRLIFGGGNCREMTTDDMKKDFNEWLLNRFVFFPEILVNKGDQYTYYNQVKNECDPMVGWQMINPKYGRKFMAEVFTMTLMATNNPDALGSMGEDDRRVYVITNTHKRNPPEYFKELHAHIESPDAWLSHLYSDLKNRDLREWDGYAPAPLTRGKSKMVDLTEGPGDRIGRLVMDAWKCDVVPVNELVDLAERLVPRMCSNYDNKAQVGIARHARAYIKKNTFKIWDRPGNKQIEFDTGRYRIACKHPSMSEKQAEKVFESEWHVLLKPSLRKESDGKFRKVPWREIITETVLDAE